MPTSLRWSSALRWLLFVKLAEAVNTIDGEHFHVEGAAEALPALGRYLDEDPRPARRKVQQARHMPDLQAFDLAVGMGKSRGKGARARDRETGRSEAKGGVCVCCGWGVVVTSRGASPWMRFVAALASTPRTSISVVTRNELITMKSRSVTRGHMRA